jgi:alpha-tubulin suppressor-like RCC1 family protein
VGSTHACAITRDRDLRCWGDNFVGQLGTGNNTESLVPIATFAGRSPFSNLEAGPGATCAVTSTGSAFCAGRNSFGRLGVGDTTNRARPAAVAGLTGPVLQMDISSDGHACALLSTGKYVCWGANNDGQLGNGANGASLSPVQVRGF